MAVYGLKYYGSFKDYFNNDIILKIKKKDYTGESEEVFFNFPAGSIEYNGSDTDLFNPFITSSLNIELISDMSFKFIELYSSDSQQYKIYLYKNNEGVLIWTGSIIPELFVESYINPPYVVRSVWTDGLRYLTNKTLTLEGLQTHLDIINNILELTGLSLPVVDCVNIYEETHSIGGEDSPLTQTYVDMLAYNELNCFEILNDILNIYGSRIYQKNGEWWIVPVHQFTGEFIFRRFAPSGVLINTGTYNPEILIDSINNVYFANVNQELQFLPGLKEFNIELDQSKRDSFILNSDFSEWEKISGQEYGAKHWIGTGSDITIRPYRNTLLTDISVFTIKELKGTGSINYQYGRNRQGSTSIVRAMLSETKLNYAKLLFRVNNTGATPTLKITQHIENKLFLSSQILSFSLNYAITNTNKICKFWVMITLTSANTYYLKNDGTWGLTQNYIEISGIQGNIDSINQSTFTFESKSIPSDGNLIVDCFASNYGYLNVFEFKGELLKNDLTKFEPVVKINKLINENNNFIPDTITLFTGDFYQHENIFKDNPQYYAGNEALAFRGGLYLNSDKRNAIVTKRWQIKDLISTNGFGDSLLNTILNQRTILIRPQWVLSGDILLSNFNPDIVIVDYSINSKKYLLSNGSYNISSCTFSGTAIEIWKQLILRWILEDGTWNDDGVWIDEDTWNDEDISDVINITVQQVPNDRLIPLSDYISINDTIETLTEPFTVISDYLKDNGSIISTTPHEVNGNLYFYVSYFKINSYVATFTATIQGNLKTINIYVYL